MKSLRNAAALGLASILIAGTAAAQVKDYKEIQTPALRKFSIPQPKRIQLANGMVIFLQEDHELPLVRGSATIRGGSREVPDGKEGLAGIYSASWRTGGTTSKTGDELDQFLEARAARVETSGDDDSMTVSMDILKGDLDAVFPIWLDVLKNPAFRQDKIDLAKTQASTGISRRNDEPGGIVGREATKLGYGAGSPYARQTEYATLASVTRDDLVAFHKRFLQPNNMIVSFIGDFDSAKLEKKLRDTFSGWPKGPQAPAAPTAINPAKPGLYFVAKDDVTQASIAMVHPGILRNNPDFYATVVMNEIFSGSFAGRLMQRLRSQRGLTYGVSGGIGSDWDHPGLFRVQMSTKSGTALESVEALRGEVRALTTDPVTADDLAQAKDSILNAFVFTMDTRAKALNQQVLLEFYGFPSDYYVKYPSMIQAVTAADVERVAKKYVHPDQLAILVLGKEKDFEKPLNTLGSVTALDITIPEPGGSPAAKSAAPSSGNAEGLALANKVADFVGGKAKADAVQSMRRLASMKMVTPQGEMEIEMNGLTRYPDAQRVVMTMPMGTMTRVISPDAAFMITPMGTQDIPSSQRDATALEMKAELLAVIKNIGNPKYVFTAGPAEKIGGVDARLLEINADGANVKWYVDPSSGKLLRSISRSTAGPAPGDVVTDYTEWKSFGGVNLPTAATITRNGERAGEFKVTNVELNPAIEADAFVKPATN